MTVPALRPQGCHVASAHSLTRPADRASLILSHTHQRIDLLAMATPAVQHKTLFVLIDGVGDVNIPSLATPAAPLGLTPLQAARTPTLDALASQENNGQHAHAAPLGCWSGFAVPLQL